MTQEEKQLLFKDLCARLPYGVMVSVQGGEFDSYKYPYQLTAVSKFGLDILCKVYNPIYTPFGVPSVEDVKPYLRPMSSMTQEEIDEYDAELDKDMDMVINGSLDRDRHITSDGKHNFSKNFVAHFGNDWLNKKRFDYRGLIPMGLALEAPEGMYEKESV